MIRPFIGCVIGAVLAVALMIVFNVQDDLMAILAGATLGMAGTFIAIVTDR